MSVIDEMKWPTCPTCWAPVDNHASRCPHRKDIDHCPKCGKAGGKHAERCPVMAAPEGLDRKYR